MGYLKGFFLGLVLFLALLFQSQFDVLILFSDEWIILLLSLAGVMMRFLSRFGVMLTYSCICSIILRNVTEQAKGSRKRMRLLKIGMVAPRLLAFSSNRCAIDVFSTHLADYGNHNVSYLTSHIWKPFITQ